MLKKKKEYASPHREENNKPLRWNKPVEEYYAEIGKTYALKNREWTKLIPECFYILYSWKIYKLG